MFRTALARHACVFSLVTTALCATASAVAPTGHQGHEPIRVRTVTAAGQGLYRVSAAWNAFTAGEGAGWQVRVDERTQTPHRMWGAGIDLGELKTEADVELALRDFISRHSMLLGATREMPLSSVAYDRDSDSWYADFSSQRDGIDIWRAELTFRIKHGKLVMVGAETYADTPARGAHTLDHSTVVAKALETGPAPQGVHSEASVTASWLPRIEDNLLVLRAVNEVRTHTDEPLADWVVFADAETGETLEFYNEIRFFAGTLTAEHDSRFPGSGTAVSAVKGAVVNNGTQATTTAADGSFNIADGIEYQAHFLSNTITLADDLGDQGLEFTDTTPQMNASNHSIAAIDTWVFVNEVRDAFNLVVPNLGWTDGNLQVTVNINDSCNAYYNGTLNFFTQGGGCNNTGRLADVVYHEWGHGLHADSILSGSFDGALSEGAGDVTSFLMTGDPAMAPGFFQSGGFLRNADNDNTYPDDLVGEVHEDGLIFAGAMWDVHQNLAGAYDPAYANSTTKDIFAGLLRGGPDTSEALDEALFADDDDGNLSNGTPHECAIVNGFAEHGLGQVGDISFAAGHAPSSGAIENQPVPVEVEIVGPASCAGDFDSGTAVATWRANGGAWTDTALTASGMDISGAIPGHPMGTFIEYYVVIEGAGQTLNAPTKGWRNPFSFYVGDSIEVHCDDFENGDGGWTHELLSGDVNDGADDWQHGAPGGRGGDPIVAHSGNNVWGNDLGFNDFNGAYQSDKNNRLTSPVYELGHYEGAFLQYWRWLTIEDATFDTASILANDQVVWTNVTGSGEDHHQDDQWAPHAVDLGNPAGTVQVAFDLLSDGGLEMGGWTLDDACLLVPATVNNRLGVTDFLAGEGLDGIVTLGWTNPVHAPLTEVRVVRKLGSCPTDVNDGEVVFYDNAPELGARVTGSDAVPTIDVYCYGVFPGDGTDFLGFSVPGWNTDEGSANTAATPEQEEEQEEENGLDELAEDDPEAAGLPADGGGDLEKIGGCGCNGSGTVGMTSSWLVGLLLLARRR